MIELYFDNKEKSGGGGVREVQPGPVDGQAIVYFEDWKGMYSTYLIQTKIMVFILNLLYKSK